MDSEKSSPRESASRGTGANTSFSSLRTPAHSGNGNGSAFPGRGLLRDLTSDPRIMHNLNSSPSTDASGHALSSLTQNMDRRLSDLEARVTKLADALQKLETSLATASKTRSKLAEDVAALKKLLQEFVPQLQNLSQSVKDFGEQLTLHAARLDSQETRLTAIEASVTSLTGSMERFIAWVETLPDSRAQ